MCVCVCIDLIHGIDSGNISAMKYLCIRSLHSNNSNSTKLVQNKKIIHLCKTCQIIQQNISNPPDFPPSTGQIKIPNNTNMLKPRFSGEIHIGNRKCLLHPPHRNRGSGCSIRKRVNNDIVTSVIRVTIAVSLPGFRW